MRLTLRCTCGRALADVVLDDFTHRPKLVGRAYADLAAQKWIRPGGGALDLTYALRCAADTRDRRRRTTHCSAEWRIRTARLVEVWDRQPAGTQRAELQLGADL